MGNFLYTLYTAPTYTVEMTNSETETGDKNRYYWFGLRDGDLDVYELMEAD